MKKPKKATKKIIEVICTHRCVECERAYRKANNLPPYNSAK